MFVDRLAGLLEGPDTRLRAHLTGAQLLGVIQAWTIMDPEGVTDAALDRAIELYGASLQCLISPDGDTR
ncbi:hypothetical protein ETD85_21075 [Nonomuraea zeae]|uniref:Tetracyclin repressor-like C-terminal domain-containing protein n=1 Tax=Nonomuraea zeae TaxID=1642303 RepID=A0A5S4GJ78_9ACTN|nr:hypothetical protein ETD85_21075 [Nonomuraea zeae]